MRIKLYGVCINVETVGPMHCFVYPRSLAWLAAPLSLDMPILFESSVLGETVGKIEAPKFSTFRRIPDEKRLKTDLKAYDGTRDCAFPSSSGNYCSIAIQ